MQPGIRLLSASDAAVLDCVAEGVFDHPLRPDLVAAFFANPSNVLAVAVADGVVVGMTSAIVYVHPDKPLHMFVNEVGVAPEWRRRGIAKRLVRAVLDRSRELGCTEAWLATEAGNAAACALYASLGGAEDEGRAVIYKWPAGS
ncbi:MAG: hypothetical protein HMLKMBBP_01946 [Planctomycetes bacterium]|nr:hypothetical protein [Planctomycetota bacterium]